MKQYKSSALVLITIILSTLLIQSCKDDYTPKARGYYRQSFPEKKYIESDSTLPYLFDIPVYAVIEKKVSADDNSDWVNIQYQKLNATLHLSYNKINNNLNVYTEDSRKMVYKHSGKADAIVPTEWTNYDNKVYGILYKIKGNAASTIQFHLTDSIDHFLRGSFYFNVHPNKDSLAPAQEFIKQDIDRMIESFKWNPNYISQNQ